MKWKPGPFDAKALPSYYTVLRLAPSHASDQKAGGHIGTFKGPMHLIWEAHSGVLSLPSAQEGTVTYSALLSGLVCCNSFLLKRWGFRASETKKKKKRLQLLFLLIRPGLHLGMVTYAFHPSALETEAGDPREFLFYIVSFRTAGAKWWYPVSKQSNTQKYRVIRVTSTLKLKGPELRNRAG